MENYNEQKNMGSSDPQAPSTIISDVHHKKIDRENMEEFDDILAFVGASGRYQKFLLYGSLAPILLILALISNSTIFVLFIPDHFCDPGVSMKPAELEIWKETNIPMESGIDGIEEFSSCRMYNFSDNSNQTTMTCQNGWIFDKTDFENTIPTEYDWVCDKNAYSTYGFTASAVGVLVGNMVFGPLADKFGRKPILFVAFLVNLGSAMISFFVPHLYGVYLALTFLSATGYPQTYSIPQLLMSELCDNNYRSWVYTVAWVSWVFGMATVPLIAYLARTWFVFAVSVTAPGVIMFLLFTRYPESPRWLVSMGRVKDAAAILHGISKTNGTSHKITQSELENELHKLTLKKDKDDKVLGFWTLFSKRRLAMITCLVAACWTGSAMIYSQITLNAPYMSGNQFLNFFILAVVEIPGGVLAGFLISRFGRRWTPVVFYFFICVVCLVAGIGPQDMTPLIITCIVLAKFSVTVTFYVMYIQAIELFPTPLRATGNALSATVAAAFGLLNATVVYTGQIYSGAPYLVMALISCVGCLCSSFLPETLRQHLPETIEDAENFGKGNKYWSLHPDYDKKKASIPQREIQTP